MGLKVLANADVSQTYRLPGIPFHAGLGNWLDARGCWRSRGARHGREHPADPAAALDQLMRGLSAPGPIRLADEWRLNRT